jgi:trehalose 6-phosphate phosphatase
MEHPGGVEAQLIEEMTADGRWAYEAFVADAGRAVAAFDFDGTLAPIVDDPERARIHPDAGAVLVELADVVHAIAVVTGRPARQALSLGDLDEVGRVVAAAGTELYLFGQYGNERWSTRERRVVSPRPPAGLSAFLRDLPRVLREADAADAYVEDKGLARAVHTRRLPEPEAAYRRLLDPLRELAERCGLAVEPGRQVIEVRAPGMHKGKAVERLVEESGAGAVLFAGDDLGDVEAFRTVRRLGAERGMPTLLVCSASAEQAALEELADVVVHGPDGVLALLRRVVADAGAGRH